MKNAVKFDGAGQLVSTQIALELDKIQSVHFQVSFFTLGGLFLSFFSLVGNRIAAV